MSTVRATNFQNAGSANVNMTLDTNGNAIFAGMVDPGYSFMRNKIINGAMVIDQRNAGASVTVSSAAYTLDRWVALFNSGSGHTIQQVTDAPTGFTNSLKLTVGTGAAPTSAQQNIIWQAIEGYNISELNFGTANASAVTLSFWVKASISGTYSVWFVNGTSARSYVTTFVVNSTGTWEYKTVTFTGDTAGTWATNNTAGILVGFNVGSGASFQTTANTWAAGNFRGTSGSTSLISTSSATFQVSGVQLESGTIATPFERRQYGQEFSLCQRYYQAGLARLRGTQASGVLESTMLFPVTMRATPTMTGTDISALSSATLLISTTLNSTGNVSWTASAEL